MAEVLTQSQIDALLNSMQSGGDTQEKSESAQKEEKSYRLYDFNSPKKFTKDRLRMLKTVYDNYCRIASSQINSLFRTNSEMEVVTVEEQRYYEYSNVLLDNDILTLVDLKFQDAGKYQPLLLHISQPLMVSMMDRMLGGSVMDMDIDTSYVYTELEMPLYLKIVEYLIGPFRDAWSGYIKLSPQINRLEENPGLFQDIGVDETVVIIMISVDMQGRNGSIAICIPENLLNGIFAVIDSRRSKDDDYEAEIPDMKKAIMDKIRDSVLTVKAQLSKAELSMGDVYNLKVGDVIDLNRPQDSEVCLYVEEQPWFEGQLGVSNKQVAVKINSRLDEETEDELEIQADDFVSTV